MIEEKIKGIGDTESGWLVSQQLRVATVHSRIHTSKVSLETDDGFKGGRYHPLPMYINLDCSLKLRPRKTSTINTVICKLLLYVIRSLDPFLLENRKNVSNYENILVSLRDH